MKGTMGVLLGFLGGVIMLGLVLRYGGTSVPLAELASQTAAQGLDALTLANPNTYPYYGPSGYNG